ncbi:MAG: ABC transporter ATP-binding protein [Planctomycetota bacterium]|nr:MAG: ABC transporter ATP-binding protein [Planctomycetota bacterium]
MSKVVLQAEGLHKSYILGHERLRVLRGVNLSVRRGEFLSVMGASGSGKSTLLHLLGALDLPDRGRVLFEGRDLLSRPPAERRAYRNREVGFVFQFYHLLPECNVLENVMMPRMVRYPLLPWRRVGRQARRDALALLERVGLSERIKHRPAELSGGERQRVAIARALINRPAVLLADEPTGNLDAAAGKGILDLLAELNREGQTLIMVTHDATLAQRADRCVRLQDGVIRPASPAEPPDPARREAAKEVTP